ncbi:hypothetical protein HYH91_19275, partial [Clostridium sporogenes]|nr:hypothetical protein [Clostridium sporogenes]
QLADITTYSTYKLNKDENDIYTEIQHKRKDGKLIGKSILSGGTSPKYSIRTETYYKEDGITVDKTLAYTLLYDADDNLISEVLA